MPASLEDACPDNLPRVIHACGSLQYPTIRTPRHISQAEDASPPPAHRLGHHRTTVGGHEHARPHLTGELAVCAGSCGPGSGSSGTLPVSRVQKNARRPLPGTITSPATPPRALMALAKLPQPRVSRSSTPPSGGQRTACVPPPATAASPTITPLSFMALAMGQPPLRGGKADSAPALHTTAPTEPSVREA